MEFCHVSIEGPDIVLIAGTDLFPALEREMIRRAQEGDETIGAPVYVVRFTVGSPEASGELGYFKFREWCPLGSVALTKEELEAGLYLRQRWFLVEDCVSAFEHDSCGCIKHTTWDHSPLYRSSFNEWCVYCHQGIHYYRSVLPLETTAALCVPHWAETEMKRRSV